MADSEPDIESKHSGTPASNYDTNELSSSDSDRAPTDGDLSLAKQRDILSRIYAESQSQCQEGDTVFVIPSAWFDLLWNPDLSDKAELGPIDTSSICRDFENFVLVPYNKVPYLSVPQTVYEKLIEWYGLAPGSEAVKTVLIKDENDQLITEYDRYYVRIHLLQDASDDQARYPSTNSKPLFFTISRLGTIEMAMQRCLELISDYGSGPDLRVHKFRIWNVKNSSESEQNSVLSQKYILDPLDFAEIPIKNRLIPKMFKRLVRDLNSSVLDLVVEYKNNNEGTHWPSSFYYYNKLRSPKGTVGLSNLGNTCYMNSALQCLVHIPELRDYFLYGSFQNDINTSNPLGYGGQIAENFAALIKSLFNDRASNINSFSPRNFKTSLGHHNSMFAGYLQQDSQEFLAFLLDGLHEDLNRIVNKPFVEKPELAAEDDVRDQQLIKQLADDTWNKHKLRNDSVINDLFVGMYKSTLTCPVCDKVSVTFDPFSDLTLPLPVESIWTSKVRIFPQNSPPCILEVELTKRATYEDLKLYVANAANMKPDDLIGAEIFNHAFYNNYESPNSDSKYLPVNDLVSESDVIVFYEVPRYDGHIIIPVLNVKVEEGFRSPRTFGYPFFISLDENELDCYGAIKRQLEKHYANLSGNFDSFPLVGRSGDATLDSLSLLKQKYPNVDLSLFSKDVENCTPDFPLDHLFSLQILDGNNANDSSANRKDAGNDIWTPDPRFNWESVTDVTTLMNNVTRDIYDYQNLITNQKDEIEEYAMLTGTQNIQDKEHSEREGTTSDMDVDVENETGLEAPVRPTNLPVPNESENRNTSEPTTYPRQKLIGRNQALICKWSDEVASSVFSDEPEFSWEKPAELKNLEHDKMKSRRNHESKKQIMIEDCLDLFSKPEVLGATDSWYCPKCKEHRQATKQIQLWKIPEILTIHLKRFENRESFSDKITEVVHFPISGLDMSSHSASQEHQLMNTYDLVAVDNHYGGLGGGHYTAYAKNFEDSKWYYFDDSRVSETEPERSVSEAAYLLFYRRRVEGSDVGPSNLQELLASSRHQHQLKIEEFNTNQEKLYNDNQSDSEEEYQVQDNPKNEKVDISVDSLYNVASLEVGNSPLDSSPEENDGRRKLRLLHKNYISALPSSYNFNFSATSSDSSDGSENTTRKVNYAGQGPPSPVL
ncbi:LANO_0G03378g1_1 [Lachancea nothofagi CBS 11611]|uniref:ubiquitinyl hydrolase 1 n=1 Tax=Lachancea nothofagi CBS 11611 TaxID=1266666 RepID=A0A1G4KFP9_9SACH|nr:LANO_0G03378g1_1 [Lachancea nothofagi CBS 11611]